MGKKRTLYLHIGRPKVGSTALQHFLWNNRERLAQQGILYPATPMLQKASHKLALVFQPELPDARSVRGTSAEAIYAAMLAEARRSGLRRLVASSENLFLVDPALPAAHLRDRYDTKIVCYVRRQDEVLASSYVEELKSGLISGSPAVEHYVDDPERLRWLDYAAVLDRWASAFGTENILVRVYETGQLAGGSMLDDFAALIGADVAALSKPRTRLNPSPARDVLDFIVMLNELPVPVASQKYRLRDPLLMLSEHMGANGRFDAKSIIPAAIRQAVLERFRESNAEVARRYLGHADGVLFREQPREASAAADRSYAGLELDRFARMAAMLFSLQQHRILQLQKQIDELKARLGR
ncbi:hypothetical protein AAG565_03280 [Fontimonas sp. SYSU GA230001]|uniref:hypothetical protein n=1 Tax=Fontimonas sp. SYSU GA230001 TaxID=3142450 RepID=UPI0032B4514E